MLSSDYFLLHLIPIRNLVYSPALKITSTVGTLTNSQKKTRNVQSARRYMLIILLGFSWLILAHIHSLQIITPSYFDQYMREVHTDEKPFKCDECGLVSSNLLSKIKYTCYLFIALFNGSLEFQTKVLIVTPHNGPSFQWKLG